MPNKGTHSNGPILGDCKSRKETNNAFHLSHLPNSINAKGEVLNGLSCFWARCAWGNIRGIFSFIEEMKLVDHTALRFCRPSWQGHYARASSTALQGSAIKLVFYCQVVKAVPFLFFTLFSV